MNKAALWETYSFMEIVRVMGLMWRAPKGQSVTYFHHVMVTPFVSTMLRSGFD